MTSTILVVDDSDTFRLDLRQSLEQAGYEVLEAATGRTGLAMIAERRPDAILVEGRLPDIDGPTIIRRVRLDAATRAVPCLLLTTREDQMTQLGAFEAGADAFISKDEEREVMVARLAAVLRRAVKFAPNELPSLNGPQKILAVDDNAASLRELARALGAEGYDVLTAISGEDALDLIARHPVDCILMDLAMPGMGGIEACVRIKAAPGVREIPLILLTSDDEQSAVLEGLLAGADDYLAKSAATDILAARVRAQIRRKQFEDENRRYREELYERELEAAEERSARLLAEAKAEMVGELERTIEQRTKELQTMELERGHAERMASLGMLSASIAHEINNPLAVVLLNLELLQSKLAEMAQRTAPDADTSQSADLAKLIQTSEDFVREGTEAADRVREIIHDLHIYSRSDTDQPNGPVDIRKVITSAGRMASNEVRHRAKLTVEADNVPPVLGNESRLGQVLVNMIVNAAQAIAPGHADGNEIKVRAFGAAGDHVAVEVSDTGHGIPADKIDRIFEPFFTTKPVGIGSGLGLAICQRIVTELGGTISVENTGDAGTTFRILLPKAHQVSAPATTSTTRNTIKRHRILVVDDEAALCATMEEILQHDHDVTAVTSGREALGLMAAGRRFDLIVSDLMMPEMSGMQLCAALRARHPELAESMIFMTGGALAPEALQFVKGASHTCIDKPFRAATLRDAVNAGLDKGAGRLRLAANA